MNRYEVFVTVVESGSFTKAAEKLNYTQSAVSQMVHTLEEELSTTLVLRSKTGIVLTPDGKQYLPYIRSICNAHRELKIKSEEMHGLQGGIIKIGVFTSVSCNWLPEWMKTFKEYYPSVQFELKQGEYTTIGQWIKEGSVDFGFINPRAVSGIKTVPVKTDAMMAVLPPGHPLAAKTEISLKDLASEPYILLAEGDVSVPMDAFSKHGLTPQVQYKVEDDYTIMAMVEQGLGVSVLYTMMLENNRGNYEVRPLSVPVERVIALGYKNKKTLPVASRYFLEFILEQFQKDSHSVRKTTPVEKVLDLSDNTR